jgi:starch synthase
LGNNVKEFKQINKIELCKECKLKYNENIPLIGVISRLDEQKGIDVLIDAIPSIMEYDIQLVVLGQGSKQMKDKLSKLRSKYSKHMALIFAFDDDIAHRIEAGADMYIMPSRQEACGLNFLYSLGYGTIPIAHLTGGIKDNAMPIKKLPDLDSNCFGLKTLSSSSLVNAVKEAVELYSNKEMWLKWISNVISKDYSWNKSAGLYDELYRKIVKE